MDFMARSAQAETVEQAVASLREQFEGFTATVLVFFASYKYDSGAVARLIQDAFPDTTTLGCSSYAELSNTTVRTGSIAALGFGPGALDRFEVTVMENMSTDDGAVDTALADLEKKLGSRLLDLEFKSHFGMTIFDGRKSNNERILERIGNLTDIIFVGGYASDDFSMKNIHVYCNGRSYTDASVMAVVKPRGTFALLKTQSPEPTGKVFVATKVDLASRTVLELDGRPAAEVYAEAIGVPVSELRDEHFVYYSFGLMANGEPFIRAVHSIAENGGVQMFYTIHEGQRLCLMKAGDFVPRTAKALEETRAKLGGIRAILDFDCAHRDMAMREEKMVDQYGALFEGIETAGYATFGEAYIANVNQTSVMAVFA